MQKELALSSETAVNLVFDEQVNAIDMSGHWSNLVQAATAGACLFSVNLTEKNGTISGVGEIKVPTDRKNTLWSYVVEITGSRVRSNVSLRLNARFSQAWITGSLNQSETGDLILEARFAGFGFSLNRLVLHKS